MNPKQLKFCRCYLANLNAAKAAKLAGYNTATAYRLLKQPEIKNYLQERMEQADKEAVASLEEVMRTLTEIMRNEKETPQNRLKAANLIAKAHGVVKDKGEQIQIIFTGEDDL